jgi:threonine/homoserine/homoserine lactone efflux protein
MGGLIFLVMMAGVAWVFAGSVIRGPLSGYRSARWVRRAGAAVMVIFALILGVALLI